MIAKLPGVMQDVADAWPIVVSVIAGFGLLRRQQRAWMRKNISNPIDEARRDGMATQHLVAYHLGPNGTTKPLHQRVADIEAAAGIEAPAPKPYPTKWTNPDERRQP